MKKILVLILCILLAMSVLSACSGDSDRDIAGSNSNDDSDIDISTYKAPADIFKIDTNAKDPSNDDIRFVYDEDGRVSQCYYEIEGYQVFLNYNYEDGHVEIFGFMGSIFAAYEDIELTGDYDASIGFTDNSGYYFKGYNF